MLAGVADWRELTSRDFATFAERTPFYAGAVRGLILAAQHQQGGREGGGGTHVSDEVMLERLANEGWVERG